VKLIVLEDSLLDVFKNMSYNYRITYQHTNSFT